jgi:hypothetical protein
MGGGIARGNGEAVRLTRGASLADFADKINANPARSCRWSSPSSARW